MKKKKPVSNRSREPAGLYWHFRLYVADEAPGSFRAFKKLKVICEEYLPGRYRIEVIDVIAHPLRARSDNIVALPTLVRKLPEPMRMVIGDLSDTPRFLASMRICE